MSGWWRLKSNRIVDTPPGPINQDSQINDHEKHPYVPALKVTSDMSNGQKETVKYFNSMRKYLMDHGLMDEKNGGA